MLLNIVLALALATTMPGVGPVGPDGQPHPTIILDQLPDHPAPGRLPWTGTPDSRGDWQALIDATWGEGEPTAYKLEIFDRFWNDVDTRHACFNGIEDRWDELRERYRDEVAGGVSAGRFAGILGQLSLSLRESHTYAFDLDVYTTSLEHGIPILATSSFGWTANGLGAAVTGLDDGTGLVYRAVPDNPLGLEPGDIIVGYDGRPWGELRDELLAAELPVRGAWGTSPQSWAAHWAGAVGANWHLFATMDVIKYATGELVHLDTLPLDTYSTLLYATEQMPLSVPFPDPAAGEHVTWGVLERAGQEIGYIYVHAWTDDAGLRFDQAIRDLLDNHDTAGLIIDFRLNRGGNMFLSNDGLSRLFTAPTATIDWYVRDDPEDHLDLRDENIDHYYVIPNDPSYGYLRPIAVLVGPAAFSSGDQVAYRMTFHPTARFFGRSTAAAFNAPEAMQQDHFYLRNAVHECGPVEPAHTYLTHQDFVVDVPVWLEPADVAQGVDTVVESAVDWIFGTVDVADPGHPGQDQPASPDVRLIGAHPNPFNPSTSVHFSLARSGPGTLACYDLAGRRLRAWDLSDLPAGDHRISWDGRAEGGRILPSGTYLMLLRTTERTDHVLVTLMK